MRKTVLVLILLLGIIFGLSGQNSGPMDLVVLFDTSASMSNSYRETSDYLIGPFLREFLRIGDTFHLISFSGTPKTEISRRVDAVGDVEAIIGRLLLMYPLDPQSDVRGALSYAENYSSSLQGNRPLKLVLVTDGDSPDTQSAVDESSARLKSRGIDLQYIKVPVTGTAPSSGRPAQTTPQTSQAASSQAPAPTQTPAAPSPAAPSQAAPPAAPPASSPAPAAPQAASSAPAASQTQPSAPPVSQPSTQPSTPAASQTPPSQTPVPGTSGGAVSEPPVSQPPAGPSQPPSQTPAGGPPVQPSTQPSQPQAPAAASSQPAQSSSQPAQPSTQPAQPSTQPAAASQQSGGLFSDGIPLPLLIALGILALAILGLLIFFALRRLHDSPNRVMAQAAAPIDRQEQARGAEMMGSYAEAQKKQERPPLEQPPPKRSPMPKDKIYTEKALESSDGRPIMLNLFVEDQNTAIGRRNIHMVKSGYNFSVGGGKSDFLVFLVPIPPHIADVHYDGHNCTFIPRKPQYFPDIGSQQVSNCIGKNIRVISDKNYELFIRIEKYEDPLHALNKLLRSIEVPGEVK